MRTAIAIAAFFVAAVVGGSPASATDKPSKTVYVDCEAAPAGDGSKARPFRSITAAVPVARAQAVSRDVTVDVAEGVCDEETFPIQLDFPVRVQGARSPHVDGEGRPVNGQDHDTLITWVPPSPAPASLASLAFIRITGADVRVSRMSLDARILPGTTTPGPAAPAPIGVLADRGATNFEADHLRFVRIGIAVRAHAAGGRIRDNYAGTVGGGFVLTGGDPTSPPLVIVRNNRVEDYWTGALAVAGAGPAGQSIRAVLEDNDTVTTYADTGPSNPFGLRINPKQYGGPFLDGAVDAVVTSNRFRGSPRFAVIVDGGQLVRRTDAPHYTGVVRVTFADNAIARAGITQAASLITFTNSRATQLPCELDPAQTVAQCPTLQGNPTQYWEYLEASRYELRHNGELDGVLIHHPQTEPVDGRVLGNVLVVNGQALAQQTYVNVPYG